MQQLCTHVGTVFVNVGTYEIVLFAVTISSDQLNCADVQLPDTHFNPML